MNIQEVLNEATWGKLPEEISTKIMNKLFNKIKEGKKFYEDITEYFPNADPNKPINFFFRPTKDNSHDSNAEIISNKYSIEFAFYRNYNLEAEEYKSEGIPDSEHMDSFKDTIEHEVIHILDLLRSNGKTRSSKIKKEFGSVSKYNEIIIGRDTNEAKRAYFKDDLELNRLLTQIAEFFKDKKVQIEKKVNNKQDILKFIRIWDGEESSEAFSKDEKLYRALILRLNREGVLPKNFK